MNIDQVIERARKLMAMAAPDSGATENEMLTAARMLRKLLDAHNLSTADVTNDDTTHVKQIETELMARPPAWRVTLACSVAWAFECRMLSVRGVVGVGATGNLQRATKLIFIGRSCDVEIAEYYFSVLVRELLKMAREKGRARGCSGALLRRFIGGFIEGAALRIKDRLRGERAEEIAADPRLGELVEVKDKEVQDFIDREFSEAKKVTRDVEPKVGFADGARAGAEFTLTRGMNTGAPVAELN